MKNYKGLLSILLVFAAISCKNENKDPKTKSIPPIMVDVMLAQKQEFPSTIEVNGTVLPQEMVELHAEASGRITYLNLPDGASVKSGTVLAKLNDADLQAQLQQQNVQLELAKKTEARLKKLLAVNGIDQAAYDAALSQVNLYEANANVIKAQIEKTVVKAPFLGKLGLRLLSEGAYVSPSTAIGTLLQTDKIKIDFTVPETYEHLISIGSPITIQTSTEKLSATIIAMEPLLNAATRNIKVRAKMESNQVTPGSFVKVLIEDHAKRIMVPTNTIIPDAFSNQLVVLKNGKAQFKNVETGVRTASLVEVSKGVDEGDSILISGILYVRPNALLKVKSTKTIDKILKPESK